MRWRIGIAAVLLVLAASIWGRLAGPVDVAAPDRVPGRPENVAVSTGEDQNASGGRLSALPKGSGVVTNSGVRLSPKLLRAPGIAADRVIADRTPLSFAVGNPRDPGVDPVRSSAIDALLQAPARVPVEIEGASIAAVLTQSQMVVVERQLERVYGLSAQRADDDRVEILNGGARSVFALEPGTDGYTIEAEFFHQHDGASGASTAVTVWDRQVILFSDTARPRELLCVTLALEEPAAGDPTAAADPFSLSPE